MLLWLYIYLIVTFTFSRSSYGSFQVRDQESEAEKQECVTQWYSVWKAQQMNQTQVDFYVFKLETGNS